MNQADTLQSTENLKDSDKLDRNAWKVIAVVITAAFMTQMDSTVVNVSLSTITESLHSSVSVAQWTISGYLLALALMLPINGWLVDRVGAKRLYLGCFSAFILSSILCGAARDMNELIAARIIQGTAGGLLAPLTQLMMIRVAGRHVVKVMGYAAAPVLMAPLCGPILAGAVLKYAQWAWLFYINLPVGVFAIVLAIYFIPHDKAQIQKRPFDWTGFLMISPGLVSLLYGIEQVSRQGDGARYFLFLGFFMLLAFVLHARRMKSAALIDLELFRIRTFSAASVTQFLNNGIVYAGQFLVPLYLTTGLGLSAVQTGSMLSAMGIGMLTIYPFMHFLTERFGYRAVTVGGVLLNFFGTLPFLWMVYTGFSLPLTLTALLIRGLGQGSSGLPSIAAAYASVQKERLSYATTAMNIVQRLGGPIMTTGLAIVVSLSQARASGSAPNSFEFPFLVLCGLQLLVFISAYWLPVRVGYESITQEGI